jgi:hypothetical protein
MSIKIRKDVNDRLMKQFGFYRDQVCDNPKFNSCGNITYWIDDNKIRIVTTKDEKLTPCQIVKRIADNVAYQTRYLVKLSIINSNQTGFVSKNQSI